MKKLTSSAIVLIGMVLGSGIASAWVRVCNKSNERAKVAYALFPANPQDSYSWGWWIIENSDCKVIYGNAVNGDGFAIYGEGEDSGRALHNQLINLCVKIGGKYYRPNVGPCPADASLKRFDNINDWGRNNQPDWDYTLIRAQ